MMRKIPGPLAERVGAWPTSSTQMYILGSRLGNDYCIDQIDPDATLDWGALERYPALNELDYEGRDTTLIAWLAKRRRVTALRWHIEGLTGTFDFRRTHLRALGIQPTKAMTLKLPRTLTGLSLMLYEDRQKVRIVSSSRKLGLGLWMPTARAPKLPQGVSKITSLSIGGARVVKIANLTACTLIEELDIDGDPAVSIPDPQLLARFTRLRRLSLCGVYDLDTTRFPALPQLESAEIRGITKDAAAILRQRLSGVDLEISGVKSAAWLAENLANPFREWGDDHGPRLARIAKQAWQAAAARMAKLGARAPAAAVKRALEPFVVAFNRLEIDTIMREEIYEVFGALVPERHAASVEAWFDAMREF